MIAALFVVIVGATAVNSLIKPRYYQASVTVIPPVDTFQKQSTLAMGLGSLGGSLLRNIIDASRVADIYVEILQSREVADAIIDRHDLMHAYTDVNRRSDARKRLKANTVLKATKEGAIRIAVSDLDPNRAAAIANAYVEELDRQNKRLSLGQASSRKTFLENRLREVEDRLRQSSSILSREAQVQEMLYEMLVREYEIAKIEEARNMPTVQVLDGAVAPELPMGRGTIRKTTVAALVALMFGVLFAIAWECIAEARRRGSDRGVGNAGGINLPEAAGPRTSRRADPHDFVTPPDLSGNIG